MDASAVLQRIRQPLSRAARAALDQVLHEIFASGVIADHEEEARVVLNILSENFDSRMTFLEYLREAAPSLHERLLSTPSDDGLRLDVDILDSLAEERETTEIIVPRES